jgi:Transposase DDE domain group 1
LATISTPVSAPVIAATRLRAGKTNSGRGAARLVADALKTAKAAGAGGPDGTGLVVLRADSAFYSHDGSAAARRANARFSITARMNPAVAKAISGIDEQDWTAITYPNAVWDEDEQRLISDAEIAEVAFTAFTSRRKDDHVTGRLIVRRVRRLNSAAGPKTSKGLAAQQSELFSTYRHHAIFTDSPLTLVQAEKTHRGHAIIEQVIADIKNGPLAHLPSGKFNANAAWLVLAAIAFNLTRAAGTLASTFHARATTATIRTQLINIPARLARSARRQVMHLPRGWPWEHHWKQMLTAATGPPPTRP